MYFEYLPVASEFSISESAMQQIMGGYAESLEKLGGKRITDAGIKTEAPLFYFVVTGGVENLILTLQNQRSEKTIHDPVFLIAHPANNSLPAAMEILAKLQQDGNRGRIFYLSRGHDERCFKTIELAVHDLEVYRELHKTKLGVVGAPSDWLVASSPSAEVVRNSWGPEIVPVPLDEVMTEMGNAPADMIAQYADALKKNAVKVIEPSGNSIDDSIRVYAALKEITRKYALDSLTVRCFDLVLNAKTTGCYALSQLTDEGIISGCEGDLMSTVAMIWVRALLDRIPWMANPSRLDEESNTLWLAHCTIPRNLIQEYTLRSHFESGLGVGIQGTLPLGPVTLIRIGGRQMEKIWFAEGTLVQNGNADNLCRTQVEINLYRGGSVADLLQAPLGNHIVVVLGHHMDRLRIWRDTMLFTAPPDSK